MHGYRSELTSLRHRVQELEAEVRALRRWRFSPTSHSLPAQLGHAAGRRVGRAVRRLWARLRRRAAHDSAKELTRLRQREAELLAERAKIQLGL